VLSEEAQNPRRFIYQGHKQHMLAFSKSGADFSRWCAHPPMRPPISATHPPPICESHLRKRSIRTLAWLLLSYVVCRSLEAVSGGSHTDTWAGCIVSLTTPTSSPFNASRSVWSLSLAENASRVFLASYLLR
jgi:hypothetical protein